MAAQSFPRPSVASSFVSPHTAAPSPPLPNVLVVGTPGVGKTSFCVRLCDDTPRLQHVNVGELVKERRLHDGWDEQHQAWELNDERLCDALEELLAPGGCVVDFHSTSTFPLRWFPLVVVLRASTAALHERLTARGYPPAKLRENVEAEILQVVLDEVREDWPPQQILELQNDDVEQLERNVHTTRRRIEQLQHTTHQAAAG